MIWIAHRGASRDAPENTLAAVKEAWKQGADAAEVDLRVTRDGSIVVFHDDDLLRICNDPSPVASLAARELARFDAGAHKGPAWKGEPILFLETLLLSLPPGKSLFLEIKCGPEILPLLKEAFTRTRVPADRLRLLCFDLEVLIQAKEVVPAAARLWLLDPDWEARANPWHAGADAVFRAARRAGAEGLDLNACPALDRAFAAALQSEGLSLYVWTVNDPGEARRCAALGARGITTDRPAWLRAQIEAR